MGSIPTSSTNNSTYLRTMKDVNVNRQIRARSVQFIDADGNNRGIIPTREALALAEEAGLDLVEVNSNSRFPICKLMDHGRWKYEQKRAEKNKQKAIPVKEVKLSVAIAEADYFVRVDRAVKFLKAGHTIKVTMEFKKGYQRRKEEGHVLLQEFTEELNGVGVWDGEVRTAKKGVSLMFKPCSTSPEVVE